MLLLVPIRLILAECHWFNDQLYSAAGEAQIASNRKPPG